MEPLHYSCNIGTADHLLFTKYLSSEFQECFGKVLYPLEFLQFHSIVIRIWNEWLGWLHTIWIFNINTSLLLFHDFIFPHTSLIIWLLFSCHLCCPYFSLFFSIITSFPISMLFPVIILLELHDISSWPLSLVGWTLDIDFPAPEVDHRFDW